MTNLQLRVASAVVLGLIVLAATYCGGFFFLALVTIAAFLIWHEWTDMLMPAADDRLVLIGYVCLAVMGFLALFSGGTALVPLFITCWAVGGIIMMFMGGNRAALLGLAYAALTALSVAHLRGEGGFEPGFAVIIFLFAVVWSTDIAAYFVGRAVGGPKLAPNISPGKTISGALGGLGGGIIAALVVSAIFEPVSVFVLLVLAPLLSVAAQIGDLFESALKRHAGVKDSSQIIPGHGGVMDRVDGLVFAAVLVWIAAMLMAGPHRPALALFQ